VQNASFCTLCGKTAKGAEMKQRLQHKREKIEGTKGPQKKNWTRTGIILGLLSLFGVWIYANLPKSGNPIIASQPVVAAAATYSRASQQMVDIPVRTENGKIIIPLELVQQRKFVAFSYNTPLNTVPLLAYVSGEGKIITAISMCEPCNSQRFHIQENRLICNACGSTWELDDLEAISGGCSKFPPDVVPNTTVNNEIQINENIVARWQRRI
jgi:uncharacterized membrane protein